MLVLGSQKTLNGMSIYSNGTGHQPLMQKGKKKKNIHILFPKL